ncbi:MAG: hypothetical protein Q9174_002511 [Haloplaca sp. 1 TL-2023]
MSPTIHLVRHAQVSLAYPIPFLHTDSLKAVHNLTPLNHSMDDPALTPHGENQCANLRARFPHHSSITLLVTSPLRRTLQTTLLAFGGDIDRGVKCIALPEIQETSNLPCDTGSDLDVVKKRLDQHSVDLSHVPEDWNSKKGRWAPDPKAIDARCLEARKWLKAKGEEAAVVSHGGLMHYLTEDWSDSSKCYGTGWENCEFRSYRFVEGDDEHASMEETLESIRRRKGTETPLSKDEKARLRENTTKSWEEMGFEKASSKV